MKIQNIKVGDIGCSFAEAEVRLSVWVDEAEKSQSALSIQTGAARLQVTLTAAQAWNLSQMLAAHAMELEKVAE